MELGALGTLPSWFDLAFVRSAAAMLAIASVVLVVVVILSVRSVATRLVVVALLGAAVFGLMHYRASLDHCDKDGCECTFLGQGLKGGGCTETR